LCVLRSVGGWLTQAVYRSKDLKACFGRYPWRAKRAAGAGQGIEAIGVSGWRGTRPASFIGVDDDPSQWIAGTAARYPQLHVKDVSMISISYATVTNPSMPQKRAFSFHFTMLAPKLRSFKVWP
jgi:hypothetical protein